MIAMQDITPCATMPPEHKQRVFLLALRQALLIALRAVEDYLEMPQSVPPKRQRQTDN